MTETITKPYRIESGEGIANVWWKSGRVAVKAGSAETGHTFSQIETDDPRGSGPPLPPAPQRGRDVLRTRGRGHAPRRRRAVRPQRQATTASAPREIAHAYVVRSERARMLSRRAPRRRRALRQSGRTRHGRRGADRFGHATDGRDGRLFAGYRCEILGPPLSLERALLSVSRGRARLGTPPGPPVLRIGFGLEVDEDAARVDRRRALP